MQLFSNSNSRHDNFFKELRDACAGTTVYIAVAFFSHPRFILDALSRGCTVYLLVRLGIGTSPDALSEVLGQKDLHVRFYTGRSFHPKLYIVENHRCYVGSSNLTNAGLATNQELNVGIDWDEPLSEELRAVFSEYWDTAEVLTNDYLVKFERIVLERSSHNVDPTRFIEEEIGKFEYPNIERDVHSQTSANLFISNFRKRYQIYISEFKHLQTIYADSGNRLFPTLPLRIEIDNFLSWIREEYAFGDKFSDVPKADLQTIRKKVEKLIPKYIKSQSDDQVKAFKKRYKAFANNIGSEEKIGRISVEEMFDALLTINAFYGRLRFFEGGLPGMKKEFFSQNKIARIRKTLKYLLFGQGSYEERIANCIYGSEYKLAEFGDSCVKELFGLINNEDVPICNGRTEKSMEWLGFGRL